LLSCTENLVQGPQDEVFITT